MNDLHMYSFKFQWLEDGQVCTKWVDITTSNPNGIAEAEKGLPSNVTMDNLVEWYEYKMVWTGHCMKEVRV